MICRQIVFFKRIGGEIVQLNFILGPVVRVRDDQLPFALNRPAPSQARGRLLGSIESCKKHSPKSSFRAAKRLRIK